MKILKIPAFFFTINLLAMPIWAVNIHECEDEQGNRSFHDRCPPGTKSITEKRYSIKVNSPQKPRLGTLILYSVPNCDTCDQVKEFLSIRNISVNEKNVNNNFELQEELKRKNNGDLSVPTLIIGKQVLTGYNRSALISALTEAGYTEDK